MALRTKLFWLRDCRNKDHKPEKFLGSSPDEDILCTSETNDGTTQKTRIVSFGVNAVGASVTTQKVSWVRAAVKMFFLYI